MHLPCPPAFKEPPTSSRPKSISRSERPNWPPENLTHLHQVLKIKTPRGASTCASGTALVSSPDHGCSGRRSLRLCTIAFRVDDAATAHYLCHSPAFGCAPVSACTPA